MTDSIMPRDSEKNWKPVAFLILLSAMSLLIAFALCEAFLRLSGYNSKVLDAGMFAPKPNPMLPYTLRPGYSGNYAGGKVTIGADGLRTVPRESLSVNDQSSDSGILALGDSVVFGQGLYDDETIAAKLQELFSEARGTKVYMLGVPGYTSWNEYAALRYYEDLNKIKTVVLIYTPNDITLDNDQLKLGNGEIHYLNDPLHKLLKIAYMNSRFVFFMSDMVKRMLYDGLESDANAEIDPRALDYSMRAISEIDHLCKTRKINFLVGIYRGVEFFFNTQTMMRFEAAVSERLYEAGVDHFVLSNHTDRLSAEELMVSWNDAHPSAAASRLIAVQIFDELVKREMVRN